MSDILWQDTSGNVAIWEMNGTTVLNANSSFVATFRANGPFSISPQSNRWPAHTTMAWRHTMVLVASGAITICVGVVNLTF